MGLRSTSGIRIVRRNSVVEVPIADVPLSYEGTAASLHRKFEKISFQHYMEHPEEGDMNVVLSSEEQRHLAERVQQLLLTYPEAGNDLDYYKFSGIPGFFDERIGVDMEKSDLPRGIRSWEFLGILTPQRANAQEAILGSFYLAKDANNPAITNLTFDFDWAHIAEEHPEDYQNFFRGLRDFLLRLI